MKLFNFNSTQDRWEAEKKFEATVRLAVDQIKREVAIFNNNLRKSEEYQNFEENFKKDDPTVALLQKAIGEVSKVTDNLQKVNEVVGNYGSRNAIKRAKDVLDNLEDSIKDVVSAARDRAFIFKDIPNRIEQKVRDLLLTAPDKEVTKQLEYIRKNLDVFTNTDEVSVDYDNGDRLSYAVRKINLSNPW